MTTLRPASATPPSPAAPWTAPRVVHTDVARPTPDTAATATIEWLPRHRSDRRL